MINVVEFDRGPLIVGKRRALVLAGDGPFKVATSCFVGNPPPPGFRPCEECSTARVEEMEQFIVVAAAQFWKGKTGRIEIVITDTVGETLKLQMQVLPDAEAAPRAMRA
jgi:hypothetical protein